MHSRAVDLIKQGDDLFGKRSPLLSLWQTIADNFYCERADFTITRNLGAEFADHLMTSYPLMARRDLGNAFSGMLRPTTKQWFKLKVDRESNNAGNQWLERAAEIQYRAMYDRNSLFVRATKEGDHDFAAFGQCVISVELNKNRDGLLYRCWHLRDVAWCENAEGKIDTVHRNWKPSAIGLVSLFGNKVHEKVRALLEKEPYREVSCRHIVIASDAYRGEKKYNTPYVSLHIDIENQHVMEETPLWSMIYVIPRWQTVSGSQYAYSPATVVALPDARLIQSMTRVLLEAGEKATNPPMIATQDAIRGDVNIYAGGITWADAAYDERLGDVLRPLSIDKSGIPLGMDMRDDVRRQIAEGFFLNKLNLPPAGDMTAFEVSQRIQEYIRSALPIFEPMEHEYNGALCEATFDLLLRNGAFGPMREIPESLLGRDYTFKFESPLQEAIEREKMQRYGEAIGSLSNGAQIDPSIAVNFDVNEAFRDVLTGIGVPTKWIRDENEVQKMREAEMAKAEAQQELMALQAGAQAVEQMGSAQQAVSGAA